MTGPETIRLRAKKAKSPAHEDTVAIERGSFVRVLRAWRHGILPHELVHAAVEETFGWRGFVRLVAEGLDPEKIGARGAEAETLQAEALTNAYQSELWGLTPASDESLRALVAHELERHGIAVPEMTEERIGCCRRRLSDLSARWEGTAPGEVLEIRLAARGGV
jgi:hypothetical protein